LRIFVLRQCPSESQVAVFVVVCTQCNHGVRIL